MVDRDQAVRNEDYFEEYRRTVRRIKELRDELKDMRTQIDRKRDEIQAACEEAEAMQKIITRMVELGIDATQARLEGAKEAEENLWTTNTVLASDGYVNSLSSLTDGMISLDTKWLAVNNLKYSF